MKPEHPDEALLEQGIAAWDVPEPPPGLTDRILAQNAETLTALSTPASPISSQPPALEPGFKEDTPAMLPTDLRTESSMRPFWTATALGFAAAAAIVLAFMAGRQSTTPAAIAPVVPSVEIQVTAPAPVAVPPEPPAPPVPGKTTVRYYEDEEAVETIPEPPKAPRVRGTKRRSPRGSTSPDLKNPFRDGSGSDDLENPIGDDTASDSPDSLFPNDTTSSNLESPFAGDADPAAFKNPFDSGTATLRLATHAGSAPARVSVDGKPVGKTPIRSLKVSPGKHTVVFQWASKRRSFTIDVEADEVKIVRADDK